MINCWLIMYIFFNHGGLFYIVSMLLIKNLLIKNHQKQMEPPTVWTASLK